MYGLIANLLKYCCHFLITQIKNIWYHSEEKVGGLHGVMVKVMDCRIVVREFELQSSYYVHFQTNTPGKGMNPLILPAMG